MEPEALRDHLLEEVLPFWERHSVDRECGGFWTHLARDGSRRGEGRKMLVMQTRMIYSFATAYRLGGTSRYLEMAAQGADFFRTHFKDTEHGGWFWATDRQGEPIELVKRPYGQAFAAYALAEYGRLAQDDRALEDAIQTLMWMENVCWDKSSGGFFQVLSRQGDPTDTTKRLDTHLHTMEAVFALYHATGKAEYPESLRRLCNLIQDQMEDREHGCLKELFYADWRENLPVTKGWVGIGHNLEAAWFLTAASIVLGDDTYRPLADRCLEFALRYGWDTRRGGFHDNAAPDGTLTRPTKIWWAQVEGLGALSIAYRLTGEERYLEYLVRLREFCRERFYDSEHGEWYTYLSADGGVIDDSKGSDWKAAYHITQGLAHAFWNLTATDRDPMGFCM